MTPPRHGYFSYVANGAVIVSGACVRATIQQFHFCVYRLPSYLPYFYSLVPSLFMAPTHLVPFLGMSSLAASSLGVVMGYTPARPSRAGALPRRATTHAD